MPNVIHLGAVAPAALILRVSDPDVDLSLASSAIVYARKPNGAEVAWAAALTWAPGEGDEPGVLTLRHPFGIGELDVVGTYYVIGEITTPDGPRPTTASSFTVKNRFDIVAA